MFSAAVTFVAVDPTVNAQDAHRKSRRFIFELGADGIWQMKEAFNQYTPTFSPWWNPLKPTAADDL
ncbi:MAG: hypothetical protein CBD74_12250 [Saprospirales bacterium TMED214]|nr:MAG: hypothetical protein CBD74_12250 [Saprospirales bacterium TMED214]